MDDKRELIVVDMIPTMLNPLYISKESKKQSDILIHNISQLIQNRVGLGMNVSCIEDTRNGSSQTIPEIYAGILSPKIFHKTENNALSPLNNPYFLEKLLEYLNQIDSNVSQIDIVGINATFCVLETAQGIRDLLQWKTIPPKIQILPGYTINIVETGLSPSHSLSNDILPFDCNVDDIERAKAFLSFLPEGYPSYGITLSEYLHKPYHI